jgi:hypothetical protein
MRPTDTIISLLPSLSHSELKDLKSRISSLLSVMAASPAKQNDGQAGTGDDVDFILGCIYDVLQTQGIEIMPVSVLRRRLERDMGAFEKAEQLCAYLKKASDNKLVRLAILKTGVELLTGIHRRCGIPIDGITMMRNIHHVPRALDEAFPGYAESGLLAKIVRPERVLRS